MERPLLFVDVDGVLNPYDGPCPDGFVEHRSSVTTSWCEAAERTAPTLLVPIDPALGLTRAHVDQLVAWANEQGRSAVLGP